MLSLNRFSRWWGLPVLSLLIMGCPYDESDDSDLTIPYMLTVKKSASGFKVSLWGAEKGAGWQVDYPGVTAFRATHKVRPKKFVLSPDGSELSFKVCSESLTPIERLWMLLKVKGGPTLVTRPQAINAKNQKVFVFGPLEPGGCRTISLTLDNVTDSGYTLVLDFVEVMEKIAYSSDRTDPENPFLTELFSLNQDRSGQFRVTRDSEYFNGSPSWSPGGEWIAFERMEMVNCGTTTDLKVQVYLTHPDGSHLQNASAGSYFASNPIFNPTGSLLAFDCRTGCAYPDTSLDICILNLVTDELKTFISGKPFLKSKVYQPRWSPDGKYLVMGVDGVDGVTYDKAWLISEVDPLTGDSLGPPRVFTNYLIEQVLSDGRTYKLFIDDFVWAPDSKHAAIVCFQYRKTSAGFTLVFGGLAVIDMEAVLQSALPVVPEMTKLARNKDGEPHYADFDASGRFIYFDRFYNGQHCDIQSVNLENYQPVELDPGTGWPIRNAFVADGFYNRTPAPMKPILAPFYPPWQ